jgi:DNA-binding MarR family transcriptional regulator
MSEAPLQFPERVLDSPGFLMHQLLRRGRRMAEASPTGPQLPRLMVLASIDEFGPHSQRDLCRRLGVDPSDMVAIIDRLEADGHAVRERDPADRRRHAIAITPAGRTWMLETSDGLSDRVATFLPGLDEADREQLVTLLRRALAHADDRVPAAAQEAR